MNYKILFLIMIHAVACGAERSETPNVKSPKTPSILLQTIQAMYISLTNPNAPLFHTILELMRDTSSTFPPLRPNIQTPSRLTTPLQSPQSALKILADASNPRPFLWYQSALKILANASNPHPFPWPSHQESRSSCGITPSNSSQAIQQLDESRTPLNESKTPLFE